MAKILGPILNSLGVSKQCKGMMGGSIGEKSRPKTRSLRGCRWEVSSRDIRGASKKTLMGWGKYPEGPVRTHQEESLPGTFQEGRKVGVNRGWGGSSRRDPVMRISGEKTTLELRRLSDRDFCQNQ